MSTGKQSSNTPDEIPITPEQYNDLLQMQTIILEMVARRHDSQEIIERLCFMAEALLPNAIASLMLLDDVGERMSVRAAPSVPPEGVDALAGLKPGPGGGSCGNAVYRNEAVFVHDTFSDARWEDIRQIAFDFNLCSCWSMPVRSKHGEAIGSFALSSFEHRQPGPFFVKLLEIASQMITIILDREAAEARLRAHEHQLNLFATAAEQADEGFIVTDERNRIVEVNPAFSAIYGYSADEVIGRTPSFLASGLHDREFYRKMWQSINEKGYWKGEVINRRKDGSLFTQWISISTAYYEGHKNYVAIFADLSELKQAQQKIETLAYVDPVTGLRNKTSLLEELGKNGEKKMLLLNVDHFSHINAAYGFDTGNVLLLEVASHLRRLCADDQVYSVYADEFALICSADGSFEEKIEQIRSYFYATPMQLERGSFTVTFTFGAAQGSETIWHDALLALKKAKDGGSNHAHIFDASQDRIERERWQRFVVHNTMLLDAIKQDRLVPYFQGLRSNTTGEIEHYEVLVRIVEEERVISPAAFLEQAKLSGQLSTLTQIMIDKSFAMLQGRSESFSINITEEDLNRHFLKEYLLQKCARYAISPSRIVLEVLEGVSSSGRSENIGQLRALKNAGFRIAIDDFGAEYSNFERLIELEIDIIKIDARYIKTIDSDPKSLAIVKAITRFAHDMGIVCVAEFVHSEAVQEVVESLDIAYSQGFLFSEPSPYL